MSTAKVRGLLLDAARAGVCTWRQAAAVAGVVRRVSKYDRAVALELQLAVCLDVVEWAKGGSLATRALGVYTELAFRGFAAILDQAVGQLERGSSQVVQPKRGAS